METNRLRQFCIVFETKNLRKAADLLNMSHSALSKSLKVLQDELGIKLLVQDGRGIEVTAAGREFQVRAREFLDLESRLTQKSISGKSHDGSKSTPLLKLASFESFTTHLLGLKWQRYFPDIPLQVHELSAGQIEKALVDSVVDIGITYEPIPTRGLDFVYLGKVRMGIFHRKDCFKKTAFSDMPFVAPLIPSQGSPSSMNGLDGWPDHLVERKIQYRVDLMESGLAMARTGAAAIFVPSFVARIQNEVLKENYQLIERAYPKEVMPIDRRFYLMTRSENKKDKLVRQVIEMLKAECQE